MTFLYREGYTSKILADAMKAIHEEEGDSNGPEVESIIPEPKNDPGGTKGNDCMHLKWDVKNTDKKVE